jgi:hypothetical protein
MPPVSMRDPRPSGGPPYWRSGDPIWWRYRREGGRYTPGDPEWVNPMTVVRDDADGLVAWMPAGTPVHSVERADGHGLRADPATMFTAPRRQVTTTWKDWDILRVAPSGRPWSVWLFWKPDGGPFDGYYVNLEARHLRDDRNVYTSDRVLDLDVDPNGAWRRKDEDELVLAVEQGRYSPAEAERLHRDLEDAEAVVRAWGSPFCDGWDSFRPDPSWPLPGLPA